MKLKDDILKFSKSCFEKVYEIPYPEKFFVSSWWRNIQNKNVELIRNFKSPLEAILYSQTGSLSGFDHRFPHVRKIIKYKIRKLKRDFPGIAFEEHKDLMESPYSDTTTLEKINGIPYSNIFLTHLNFYLRSTSTLNSTIERVIEVGGGYGGLARIFKIMSPDTSYIMVDLPESLFFAQVFLSMNFPDAKILYIDEDKKVDLDRFNFILIPIQFYHTVFGEKFDIAINTGSLQEMPDVAVKFWMDFIQNLIKVKMFYSFNYFLMDKRKHAETSEEEANLICPILDSFWDVRYFKINPEVASIDANCRNWLELLIERIPSSECDANALFQKALLHPKGSNDWFENLWMAFWCEPREEFVDEMLKGIVLFKVGLGAKNNFCTRFSWDLANLSDIFIVNEKFLKNIVKRILNLLHIKKYPIVKKKENIEYSEELFYKVLRASQNRKINKKS